MLSIRIFVKQELSSCWDGRLFGYSRHGPKCGAAVRLFVGEAGSPLNTMWPGARPTSVPSGIFGHNRHQDMTINLGAAVPFSRGAGSPSNAMWLALRPTSTASSILIHWLQQTWAENWRAMAFLGGGGSWVPSNTMWPWQRPSSMPSGMMLHPTVWPQYTNVADREDTTGHDRQRYDSRANRFRATVCKTVRPMLTDRCLSVCLSCLSCLSVCDVRALWPNGCR